MNKNKGFTLIELLIAMSVGTLIAMAFFTIINTSIKSNTKNEQDIKLLNVATSELENIREQIKDTSSEELQLNTVDGNEDTNISITGEELDKDKNEIQINSTISKIDYEIIVSITRDKKEYTEMYLYDVSINVKLKNNNFSKRNIELSTKIFGK